MSNLGAIVKFIADRVDRAASAVERALQPTQRHSRPKLCPIPVPVKAVVRRR